MRFGVVIGILVGMVGASSHLSADVHAKPNEQWKLAVFGPQVDDDRYDDSKRKRMLFDLEEDPYETTNLADQHPQLVKAMYAKVQAFRALMPEVSIPPLMEGHEGGLTPRKEWKLSGE